MKKLTLSLATLLAIGLSTQLTFADGCKVTGMQDGSIFNGPTTCENASLKGAIVNGPAKLNHSTFSDVVSIHGPLHTTQSHFTSKVDVYGPTHASDSQFNVLNGYGAVHLEKSQADDLTVRGPADLKGSKVKKVLAYGPVQLQDQSTANSITAYTNHVRINDATVNNITVHTSKNDWGAVPTVQITNHGKVTGTIKFVGHPGTVELDPSSTFTGSVSNGKYPGKSES